MTLRIWVGWDNKEAAAYYTLCHSLHKRSSIPLEIAPLNRSLLQECFRRTRSELESTDFSISRFLVPYLCDYRGWALFMDCDMLARTDVAELARMACLPNWYKSVFVVKHEYTPADKQTKFLGAVQTTYHRKNWSSLMLFNCERCKKLTPEYVGKATGLELHQFNWTTDEQIGELGKEWNWLVGEYPYNDEAKLIHFTRGGPWFLPYRDCDYAREWFDEYGEMAAIEG